MKCIEDEIPFELPQGWEWTRLRNVCSIFGRIGFRGYTKNDLVEQGNGAITLSPSNIINNKMNYAICTYISWYKYDESPEIQISNKDILLVKTGSSYGKAALVENLPQPATINPQFVVLKNKKISAEYLCFVLQSLYARSVFDEFVVGTAIPTFTQEKLNAMYIPIPPLKEQNRIISKLKKFFYIVDTIENDKSTLQETIQLTKSKILDLAIRGKLVPQDPTDEPASILLERIRNEKEELIKQGKIKRDKKESVIFKGEDNSYYEKIGDTVTCIDEVLPFEIPDDWRWIRLSSACIINPKNSIDNDTIVSFVPMTLIQDSYTNHFTSERRKWKEVRKGFTHFAENDVGFAKITPCFENRKSVVFQGLSNGYGAGTTELHILRAFPDTILPEYLLYMVKSEMFISGGKRTFSGAVGQQRISKEYVYNYLCPVPPLIEQKRIIEKCSNIMKMLHNIEKSLS